MSYCELTVFITLFPLSLLGKRGKVLTPVLTGDGLALLLTQWHECAILNLNPLLTVFRKMGKDGVLMTVSELSFNAQISQFDQV